MNEGLRIMLCEQFRCEVEAVLKRNSLDGVSAAFFASRCGQPPLTWSDLEPLMDGAGRALIIGTSCMSGLAPPYDTGRYRVHQNQQCFHMIADRVIVDGFLGEKYYLVTSGWLAHWQDWLPIKCEDKNIARDLFKESADAIMLLDTGVNPDSAKQLEAFSDFIGLPHETYRVGLGFFERFLRVLISEWQLDILKSETDESLASARTKVSNYVVAMDLFGRLTQSTREDDAVSKIMDLCSMLFSAENIFYQPFQKGVLDKLQIRSEKEVDPGQVREQILALSGKHGFTESGRGFYVRIALGDEIVGILQVEDVSFPEHLDEYLNLVLAVIPMFGLAIDNVRRYEEIKRAESRQALMTEILQIFVQAQGDSDEEEEILQLLKDHTDIEAVGMRLKERDAFPFYRAIGFPENFVKRENLIQSCGVTDCRKSEFIRDAVISGKAGPESGNFTEYGSFWSNDMSFVNQDLFAEKLGVTHGLFPADNNYFSAAIIPLRADGVTFGILQFNDSRGEMFSEERVHFLEELGSAMAIAMQRKQSADKLREMFDQLREKNKLVTEEVQKRIQIESELKANAQQLEEFIDIMVRRESRIIEMKEEVNRLSRNLQREAPYPEIWKEESMESNKL